MFSVAMPFVTGDYFRMILLEHVCAGVLGERLVFAFRVCVSARAHERRCICAFAVLLPFVHANVSVAIWVQVNGDVLLKTHGSGACVNHFDNTYPSVSLVFTFRFSSSQW